MKYQVSFCAKTWYIFTCENDMLSAHVKISLLLWLHNKSGLSHQKPITVKWLMVVHWCLYKKDNITWLLGDAKFLFLCWRNISLIRCTHLWNILQPSKRNFISPCGHVISSIYLISNKSFTKRQYNEIFIKIIMVKKKQTDIGVPVGTTEKSCYPWLQKIYRNSNEIKPQHY